jgi:hypothetical protein
MSKLPFYLAGAGGGALTSILDLVQHPNQGTIGRVGSMLKEQLFGDANVFFSPAFWGIILIVAVSVFVCWVYEATSRTDGFLRGCTVLAAFSIGAPGPIINNQVGDLGSSFEATRQVSGISLVVTDANAQTSSSEDKPGTSTGEVYVVLDYLKEKKPRPDSTITIRSSPSNSPIAIFKISDNTARILQPYGRYTVEVETPGFANITFDMTIDELLTAYSVNAQPSSVPLTLQKLLLSTKVELKPNDAEKYKQLGRKRGLVKDFDGAIANYQQSLALEPNDGITHDYLGYAFFRLGRYAEAVREFQVATVQRPDYKWPPVNLIKVDCAQQKYAEARQKFDAVRTITGIWKSDGEFRQLCAPILDQ